MLELCVCCTLECPERHPLSHVFFWASIEDVRALFAAVIAECDAKVFEAGLLNSPNRPVLTDVAQLNLSVLRRPQSSLFWLVPRSEELVEREFKTILDIALGTSSDNPRWEIRSAQGHDGGILFRSMSMRVEHKQLGRAEFCSSSGNEWTNRAMKFVRSYVRKNGVKYRNEHILPGAMTMAREGWLLVHQVFRPERGGSSRYVFIDQNGELAYFEPPPSESANFKV